jgi:hypothetical protein
VNATESRASRRTAGMGDERPELEFMSRNRALPTPEFHFEFMK